MAASGTKTVIVEIPMEEGDPLGATPDEKLVIVKIQAQTLADGKLQVGDQIQSINSKKVKDRNHFYQLLKVAHPCATLEVLRYDEASQDAPSSGGAPPNIVAIDDQIPPEREKLIDLEIARGKKLGLGIRDVQNKVIVSKVEPGSLSAGKLEVRDHIIDVEGLRVTDKDVAREMLIRSMRARGYFTCVIGRPVSEEAKKACDMDLSVRSEPPSVKLNDDVRKIAAKERNDYLARKDLVNFRNKNNFFFKPRKGLLATGASSARVKFDENANKTFQIGNDNTGKYLRPVRK